MRCDDSQKLRMDVMRIITLVALLSVGCSSVPQVKPVDSPIAPWRPVVEWYAANDTGCPPDQLIATALKGCVDVGTNRDVCLVDLRECTDLAFLDKSALLTDVDTLTARVETLSSQRWYWGLGGIAVGALVFGLAFGLAN